MTAGEVVDRIKKNVGVPWRDATYRDTYKFGGPETVVTGIATTAFVTLDVIQRAAAAGLNMIIPHEDTFWNDRDDSTVVSRDPLYSSKVDLLRKHDSVVFSIHDHMHAQRPDFTYVGSARDVGLEARCRAHFGGKSGEGVARLEDKDLLFPSLRLKRDLDEGR